MSIDYLVYNKSINAMRIFLNVLGYTLDDEYNSKAIKIKNKDMKVVGKLYFDDKKAMVKIRDKYLSLVSECDLSVSGDFNVHKIKYEMRTKKASKLNTIKGKMLLTATEYSTSEKNCTCGVDMMCTVPGIDNVSIKVLSGGKLLGINIDSLGYSEKIEVNSSHDACIKHGITKTCVDMDKCEHTYRLHAGIYNSQMFGKYEDKLHIIVLETLDDKTIRKDEDYIDKTLSDGTSELLMQKGALMRRLDHTMIERIQHVRNLLSINNTNILDNIISVCCEEYSDEELQVLFGIKKSDSIYQDGASNLTQAYFDEKEVLVRKRTNNLKKQ